MAVKIEDIVPINLWASWESKGKSGILFKTMVKMGYASIRGFDCGLYPLISLSDDLPVFTLKMRVFQVQQGIIKPVSCRIEMVYRLDC